MSVARRRASGILLAHAETDAAKTRRWSALGLIIAVGVVVADQVTKSLALSHVSAEPHHVVGPIGLQLTYNTGSAFSLFQGSTALLAIIGLVMACVIGVLVVRAKGRPMQVGLGLMLGGAIGNLADRVARRRHDGGVIDFITLSHWPTFNVADAAITCGVAVILISLAIDMVRGRSERGQGNEA